MAEEQPIIIYKAYTPQRAAYCRTYYQEHREAILERKQQQYRNNYDTIKHTAEYKENKKKHNDTYINKIKNDPLRLEKLKQYKKLYYERRNVSSNQKLD